MEKKLIPFSTGFFATANGRIFDSFNKERPQYENGDGYKTASVKLENGLFRTFGVHRLVMLAFSPIENSEDFTVNHRDLDKKNNALTNLEWLTVEQNNLHAALFRKNPRKALVYLEKDGEYSFAFSIEMLKDITMSTELEIWDAVKNSSRLKGYSINPITNKTLLPKVLHKNLDGFNSEIRPVKIKNISSEEVSLYFSLHEAAREHNTSPSHIFQAVSTPGNIKIFKGAFLIVEADQDFPDITEEVLQGRLGSTGFDVIVFNEAKQIFEIYPSASRFIKEKGLSKKAVTTRLKAGKVGPINGYYFAYYKNPNKQRLFEVIGRPGP